jgi:hypothetical protein
VKLEGIRGRMETWWSDFDSDALSRKDSQAVTVELINIYAQMTPEERSVADQVLGEWVRSDQERKRFDALAVIDQFRIRSAAPPLRALEADLRKRLDPTVPFELKKVRRILRALEGE